MSAADAVVTIDGHEVHPPDACAHCDVMRARGDERYVIENGI